jgi:hypothetical protein
MASEDFTTYTETDPGNDFTVTSSRITVSTLAENRDSFVYDDKGVDHFDGDYEHLETVYITSQDTSNNVEVYCLANVIDDFKSIRDVLNEDAIAVELFRTTGGDYQITLKEVDSGTQYADGYVGLNTATLYYLTIERDESVGTYGTIYLYLYDDSDRTSLVDTMSITLHTSKKDYRYVYGIQSFNSGNVQTFSGYTENLDLQEAAAAGGISNHMIMMGVG